jgi:hypothetical protein
VTGVADQSLPEPLTAFARVELLRVADEIERFGLRRNAKRIREALDRTPEADERPCAIQDDQAPTGHGIRAIPWGLAEILYPAYGHDQTLERLAERGGFSRRELGALAVDAYTPRHPRLQRMPLLELYEAAKR